MGAIYAKDFRSNLHDKRFGGGKHYWNAGGLRHVVKALAGAPVVIELDNMTGYVQVGVTLLDVRGRFSGGQGVAVADAQCVTPQNPQGITVFSDRKVGVIIPMDGGNAKWDALESERREHAIALRLFQARFEGTPVDGNWDMTSFTSEVHVSYEPGSFRRGNGEFDRFTWKSYGLAEIQDASLCNGCLIDHEGQRHERTCTVQA